MISVLLSNLSTNKIGKSVFKPGGPCGWYISPVSIAFKATRSLSSPPLLLHGILVNHRVTPSIKFAVSQSSFVLVFVIMYSSKDIIIRN